MSKKNKLIVFASLALVLFISIPSIFSYFSTFTITKGVRNVVIQDGTYITEEVNSWTKKVTIKADPNSDAVYVRVKVFAPEDIQKLLEITGEGWNPKDGYYEYSEPIDGKDETDYKDATTELDIKINNEKLPKDTQEGDEFHIVVVYESSPVSGDSANWGGN